MSFPVEWKSDAALRTYKALRAANPHLPEPHLVTVDEIDIHMGSDAKMASVSLRVFIALPESWAVAE